MNAPFVVTAYEPPPPPRRVPVEEYLEAEAQAETKSEYLDGIVRAMPSASARHLLIESHLNFMVIGRLGGRGGCVYLNGNVQIVIPGWRSYVYPDGAIACPPQFAQNPRGALMNPKVVFEVLSPRSTEGYDRGPKFRRYRDLDSLEDYVLIDTSGPLVEVHSKPEWGPKTYEGLDAVALIPSVGIELPLADLYALALSVPE